MSLRTTLTAVLATGALALGLAACSSDADTPATTTSADDATSGDTAATGETTEDPTAELATLTPGKLTIAAAEPGYPPYVIDDDPENGEGFETAVAYAVAGELGFAPEDVVWVRANWDLAIAPGAKPYDFTLQQVGIREDRAEFLDFSSPYYRANQAVVTLDSSPAAGASSLAELQGLRLGAASGTSSLEAIENVIEPANDPLVFNNNDDLKLALQNGQVDAIVVDLPTALFIGAVELEGGQVLGQLEGTNEDDDGWGLVLEKGSELTAPVTAAVDALREQGVLDELVEEWLTSQGAPVLG